MTRVRTSLFARKSLRILGVIFLIYLFLLSIKLLELAFKLCGCGFTDTLFQITSNPFLALFIGILATSLAQSSSATTGIVVSLVSAGSLPVSHAVPIIMGANIGTSVTNTLVSMGHITRPEEFRRAFAGATIHDFFNILAVVLFLPTELFTKMLFGKGFLEWIAFNLARFFYGTGGVRFKSPVKMIVSPIAEVLRDFFLDSLSFGNTGCTVAIMAIAVILLFLALYFLVRTLKALTSGTIEIILNRIIARNPLTAICFGAVITAIVQSSSMTTSFIVPLVGAGILTVEKAFPITLGANIGTTITALLAALTGEMSALAIAFVHVLFNVTGVIVIFSVPILRQIPLRLSRFMGDLVVRKKTYAFLYVAATFFVIPILFIILYRIL